MLVCGCVEGERQENVGFGAEGTSPLDLYFKPLANLLSA